MGLQFAIKNPIAYSKRPFCEAIDMKEFHALIHIFSPRFKGEKAHF
jgi:hypothetical protein